MVILTLVPLLVVAGLGSAEHLRTWSLQGVLLGVLFGGAAPLVWCFDRVLIPMAIGGIVLLR